MAVFAENNPALVDRLGKRLQLNLDDVFQMKATDSYAKKKSPFPTPCSFRTALTHYVDITSPASLNILGEMVQYTENPTEKVERIVREETETALLARLIFLPSYSNSQARLEKLVSKAAREEYNKYIFDGCRSIVVVLEEFPSIKMPVDHLLELLPALQPRYVLVALFYFRS